MPRPNDRDELLEQAIELGQLDNAAASDADLANRFAVYRELESLFHLVGSPAVEMTDVRSDGKERASGPITNTSSIRLIDFHAKGALGEVFVANDENFNRKVAVKFIRGEHAGLDASRNRFAREATITAQLEHPGIAPVYSYGEDDSGTPCYVMRFIEGQTLHEAVCSLHEAAPRSPFTTQRLEFLGLLRRFVTVCDTIAFAHRQGVIHRDLKPSNIMVGDYGETIVVDWGVAKKISDENEDDDSDSAETSKRLETKQGSLVGTPEFMSPEQAKGLVHQIGPASDIFSLGAVLYHCLTTLPPFQGQTGEDVIGKAKRGDFPRPREVLQVVPPALEAICLKAMAEEPATRYRTATDLGADVERWLADEPTLAYREPLLGRARRFIKRHQAAVASAAGAVLVALIGLAAFAIAIGAANATIRGQRDEIAAKNQDLESANEESVVARLEADQKRADAEASQRDAETQRADAERSRQQAESVANYLLSAFRSQDPNRDGRMITVAEMLKKAEGALQEDLKNEPQLRAAISSNIGTTYIGLGLYNDAVVTLGQALALCQTEFGKSHEETLGVINNLAVAYGKAGQPDKQLLLLENSLSTMKETLSSLHPKVLTAMGNLAVAYQESGQMNKAISLQNSTLQLRTDNLGRDHVDTLTSMYNLAESYALAGQTEKAISLHEQTLKLRTKTLGADHTSTLSSMINLSGCYSDRGQLEKALVLLEEAFPLCKEKMGPDDPTTLLSMNNLAMAYEDTGQLDKALPLFKETVRLMEESLGPENPDTLFSMSNLARTFWSIGQPERSLKLLERAYQLAEANLGPNHAATLELMNNFDFAYKAASQVASRLSRTKSSGKKILPLFESLYRISKAKNGPSHPETLTSLNNLLDEYTRAGQWKEGLPLLEELVESATELSGIDSTTFRLRLVSIICLARACSSVGQRDATLGLLTQAYQLAKVELGPAHSVTLASMDKLAEAYIRVRKFEKALLLREEALKLRKKDLGDNHPDTLKSIGQLMSLYRSWDKPVEAAKWQAELEERKPNK